MTPRKKMREVQSIQNNTTNWGKIEQAGLK
jgi:hypothetical protein